MINKAISGAAIETVIFNEHSVCSSMNPSSWRVNAYGFRQNLSSLFEQHLV